MKPPRRNRAAKRGLEATPGASPQKQPSLHVPTFMEDNQLKEIAQQSLEGAGIELDSPKLHRNKRGKSVEPPPSAQGIAPPPIEPFQIGAETQADLDYSFSGSVNKSCGRAGSQICSS